MIDSQRFEVAVPETAAGERLDRFLSNAVPNLTRSRLKSLITGSNVSLDAVAITEPDYRVKPGQIFDIVVPEAAPAEPQPQAMLRLWESGETLLFLIVVIFTLAFPLLKLGVALFAWRHLNSEDPRLQEALNWIEHLGRWSMLDVFVTALVIVVVKISYVSDATVHFGLYVFAAAVILSMITIRRVAVRARAESKASNTVTSKTHPERHG